MRSKLVILTIAGIGFSAVAEDRNPSLYARSLAAYVQSRRERTTHDEAIVVIKNMMVTDPTYMYPLPSKIGSVLVEFLGSDSLKAKFKKSGGQFDAVEIKPMINQRDLLIVDCTEYRVSVKGGAVILGVRGGIKIRWRFDPTEGDYVVAGVEPWRPQM